MALCMIRLTRPMSSHRHNSISGVFYQEKWVSPREREELLKYLLSLYPIWENRFSKNNPPPEGQSQRQLLRPVYWLGNWQFACLNYYHPPKGIFNRCVEAEPFPSVMDYLVQQIQEIVHNQFLPKDIPRGWHLNTCLINYYGDSLHSGKRIDCARVGEHKDFEPGPVASLSFGEKALFQFVSSRGKDDFSQVFLQQWLEDSSLQIFGGDKFKKNLFHRVQRVEKKSNKVFPLKEINDFETRRINLTFRYVPNEHIIEYQKLPHPQKEDTQEYLQKLAQHSEFFREAINAQGSQKVPGTFKKV